MTIESTTRWGLPSSQYISIAQIRAFVTAAECASFSRAAKLVQLSQPALSRTIRDMELALGVTLFERSCRGVVLSSFGGALLPIATRVIKSISELHTGMARWRAGAGTELRVLGSVSVMPVMLPTLIGNLEAAFGLAAMHVGEALSDEVRRQVLEGRAVLGVCVEIQEHSDLRYTPVLEAQFGVLASRDCALPPIIGSLRDLDAVPMVRTGEEVVCTKVLRMYGADFPAYFSAPIVVASVQAATKIVVARPMATIATGVGASHHEAAGLQFVPLPGLLPRANVYIVSRRDAVFDAHQERLREVLRDSIHDAPWHPSVQRVGLRSNGADGH